MDFDIVIYMMLIYFIIDGIRVYSILGFMLVSQKLGHVYKVLHVNELIGFGTIVVGFVMRYKFEGKMCSGDIADFYFEGDLKGRGTFILSMTIVLLVYQVICLTAHIVLGFISLKYY